MKTIPCRPEMHRFREFLDEHGYDSATLTENFGFARPPTNGEQREMAAASQEISTANILLRLFLLGGSVNTALAAEFIPAPILSFCHTAGLLETTQGKVAALVVIVPVEGLLFASDAFRILGTEHARDFVLPASTHSANFLRYLTMRNAVGRTLDLGCGCGIHALFAAQHSQSVTACDISPAAIWYTRFNAILNNINNVECSTGNLFDALDKQSFDLIISNPPFVVSPSQCFVYRDNVMDLDDFCAALLREAPAHLNDGGHLQMLCEWVEVEEQPWLERISDSIRGCDAWVLHAPPLTPAAYVAQRSSDVQGDGIHTDESQQWRDYLDEHKVRAIHPAMLVLRKRDDNNWLHVQNLSQDVVTVAGMVVAGSIAAIDFIESCDDNALLQATLLLAVNLSAEQLEIDGKPAGIYLKLDNALATDAEIDGAVAAFLNFFDSQRTVRACIDEFAAVTDAEIEKLSIDLLSIVRVFVSRGFLTPVDIE